MHKFTLNKHFSIIHGIVTDLTHFSLMNKFPIDYRIVPLSLDKFAKALATAQMIERDMEDVRQEAKYQQGRGKSVVTHARPKIEEPKGKRPAFEPRKPESQICGTCGNDHRNRPCRRLPRACFGCGEQGHMIRDCPKKKRDAPNRRARGADDRRPMVQG